MAFEYLIFGTAQSQTIEVSIELLNLWHVSRSLATW